MTIKATFFTSPACLGNRQFDLSDPVLNHDNLMCGFAALKDTLARRGIDLSTQDINPPENSAFVLFNEMPDRLPPRGNSKRHLLIYESPLIKPDNWDLERHAIFDKIFSWRDDFVNGKKYFKINYCFDWNDVRKDGFEERPKFCAVIAGNKYVRGGGELYSKRVEAIRWFERNQPGDLDLYGAGWDAPLTLKSAAKAVLQLKPSRLLDRAFPSYRGCVESKLDVLKDYKFSICFENVQGIPGYITEKIFHCLMAGCVPVYWGAPNVTDHIPEDAFVDFREFKSYGELYEHLKRMPRERYLAYRKAIADFLAGEKARPFSAQTFADDITAQVTS